MSALWWLALALLALPVWWHRRRRRQFEAQPLASARFLPRGEPRRLRAWRWRERVLLLLRCLLLAATVAWLADLVLPWRGDAVLVAAGTDPAFVERQARQAGFAQAPIMTLPTRDVFGWLLRHEREWQSDARLLLVGDIPMPALRPRLAHGAEVRAWTAPQVGEERHVAVVSWRADEWRRLFDALAESGPQRYRMQLQPDERTSLVMWDMPGAAPPGLAAHARVWRAGPPVDAAAARALFETWQELHYGVAPYSTPSQRIEPASGHVPAAVDGALRYLLTLALMALFAIERFLAHAGGR